MAKTVMIIIVIMVFILGIALGFYLTPKKIIEVDNSKEIKQIIKDIPIVGVNDKGEGVTGKITVEMKEGAGLVLVNINDVLADYNTQLSARIAAKIASNITGIELNNIDLIYNIKANASAIEGASAGSVMAVATIAALQNKNIKPYVYMTGAIDENGNILQVGAVKEKSHAAKTANGKLFLIPSAEYVDSYNADKYCTKYKSYEYCELLFTPRLIDLSNAFGLEVKQVNTVKEAADLILE